MELDLNQSVLNTLKERAVLERSEMETEIRRSLVAWLEEPASHWSLRERSKWRGDILIFLFGGRGLARNVPTPR